MTYIFNTDLTGNQYLPENAQAALIIVHGLGEHRGRYQSAIALLVESDIACFIYDQRGHGESLGSRTDIPTFSDFTDDLALVVKGIVDSYPDLPIFLWGHSLGSIVVLNYVLDEPGSIRGGVTTGCPLVALPKAVNALSKVGSWLFELIPAIRVDTSLNPELLSHDKGVQAAYKHDPLVSKSVTLKLVFELALAINRIKKRIHEIKVPWLAIHGGEDQIAPAEGSRFLIKALGSNDKMLLIMDSSRHEVQNETIIERKRFFELLTRWVKQRAEIN